MTERETPKDRGLARKFLVVAVIVVGLEALAYLVLAVLGIADISEDVGALGVGISAFLAGYGLAQLYAARKLLDWHPWARGPLVFTQLIQLGLAWGLRGSPQQWLAAVMAVSALVALACLLAPAVTRALIEEDSM